MSNDTRFRLRHPDEYPAWEDADRATRFQIMRAMAGLTQGQVASRADVAINTVGRAESDPNGQMVSTLERILTALGRTLADLLSRDPPAPL